MEQHGTEAALLPNIANQMRSLLSNLYLAASQVIPPEQREQDPALDAKAAILEQSFFRLLRLVNSMSAAEYLSDSQTLSLRDADLVKLTVSRKVSPLFFSSTVTVPPAGVNFSALESR